MGTGIGSKIEKWLAGSVIEVSTRECPACSRRLRDDDLRCPDCGEEAVEVTEYVSPGWPLD